jgi:hypothetical protein
LIVSEGLGAGGIKVVGDAVDMAGVFGGDGIDEIVSDVDGVAGGGRGFEFEGL